MQKLIALNEEYNEQLCSYRKENVKLKKEIEDKVKEHKKLATLQSSRLEQLQPEMIPPDQSFRILICKKI